MEMLVSIIAIIAIAGLIIWAFVKLETRSGLPHDEPAEHSANKSRTSSEAVSARDVRNGKLDMATLRVERNMIGTERAADSGNWAKAAGLAKKLDSLLAEYQECDGSSEEHLISFLESRGRVRSIKDEQYKLWIDDELLNRGYVII